MPAVCDAETTTPEKLLFQLGDSADDFRSYVGVIADIYNFRRRLIGKRLDIRIDRFGAQVTLTFLNSTGISSDEITQMQSGIPAFRARVSEVTSDMDAQTLTFDLECENGTGLARPAIHLSASDHVAAQSSVVGVSQERLDRLLSFLLNARTRVDQDALVSIQEAGPAATWVVFTGVWKIGGGALVAATECAEIQATALEHREGQGSSPPSLRCLMRLVHDDPAAAAPSWTDRLFRRTANRKARAARPY